MSDTKAKKIRGVYEHPSASGIYWVQWFDSLGKRHREKAGTKSAAIKLKAKRTTDKLEARKIPETLKHTADARFSELCANAMTHAQHENGGSAQSNLRGVINTLTPDFGDRQAYTITTAELLAWLRSEAKRRKWSDGTYNHYVVQLCVIFRIGQENKKVATNPARGIKRRMLDNDRPRYLNSDEAERLETTIAERWPEHRPAYQFARNTGLRAGAQFNLKWPQVDMQRKTITLAPKRNSKYRKNRVLPLNSVAYQALVEMRARSHGSDLVFAEYHRVPYLSKPSHWFPEIVEAAGVKDLTWHSLRHDFASQLVMRGVNLKTVQMLMCHATIKQTAIYAELSPEHLQSSVECLTATLPVPVTSIAIESPGAIKTATSVVNFPLSA
jgi:site-specific recombinase XerD